MSVNTTPEMIERCRVAIPDLEAEIRTEEAIIDHLRQHADDLEGALHCRRRQLVAYRDVLDGTYGQTPH